MTRDKIHTDGSSYQTVEIDGDKITLCKIGIPGHHDILEAEWLESGDVVFRIRYLVAQDVHDHEKGTLEWKFQEESNSSIKVRGESARKLAVWIQSKGVS
jgi:hypothetical protein